MHMAVQSPYVYDFVLKTCRNQAEIIPNHYNEDVSSTGNGEAQRRKQKLIICGGQAYDRSESYFAMRTTIEVQFAM